MKKLAIPFHAIVPSKFFLTCPFYDTVILSLFPYFLPPHRYFSENFRNFMKLASKNHEHSRDFLNNL